MRQTHHATMMSRKGYLVAEKEGVPSWGSICNEFDFSADIKFGSTITGTVIKKKYTKPLGIGPIGGHVCVKKKFRWVFEAYDKDGNIVVENCFVKINSRPKVKIEEIEINFLSNKTWIPGKAAWETITVTTLDGVNSVKSNVESMDRAKLTLLDMTLFPLEEWEIVGISGLDINFNDLDYTSSSECCVDMVMRYNEVKYKSFAKPLKEQNDA